MRVKDVKGGLEKNERLRMKTGRDIEWVTSMREEANKQDKGPRGQKRGLRGHSLLLHQLPPPPLPTLLTALPCHQRSIQLRGGRLRPLQIIRMIMTAKHQLIVIIQRAVPMIIHNQQRIIRRQRAKPSQLLLHRLRGITHGDEELVHRIAEGFERVAQARRFLLERNII